MNFKEIELKYRADNILLSKFQEFCQARNPSKFVLAAGYDHFYANAKSPDSFCRHRVGADSNQLTFKRKTSDTNNYVRTEHNIDLAPSVKEAQVEALCREFGYTYNTSIFKTCFVYQYDWYILVMYIVCDQEMREIGRFVEVEAREDHNWANEQEAWDAIVTIERFMRPLGVTSQARLKKSLWEIVKK